MHTKIKKNTSANEVEKKLKVQFSSKIGSTKIFFGALKRGFDGLEYQKKVRNEW